MIAIAQPVDAYLRLMTESRLLVNERDRANMDILITMLGDLDREIIGHYYGLFGLQRLPLEALAEQYKVSTEVMQDIIEKDLRKIAITPDWQMLAQTFAPAVRRRIGV